MQELRCDDEIYIRPILEQIVEEYYDYCNCYITVLRNEHT